MKKRFVLFTLLMVLILVPSVCVMAQTTYNYYTRFPYFAQGDGWWTGMSVTSDTSFRNDFSITIFDCYGRTAAWGDFVLEAWYAQKGGPLDSFTSGSIPTTGSILIVSTHPFWASKFTGNSTMGGFSEIQVTATAITP